MYKTYKGAVYELNQHDTVCRLMFVTLDISIVKTGECLLERLDIRIFFPKAEFRKVKAW